MLRQTSLSFVITLSIVALVLAGEPAEFTLTRATIDGGGVMRSIGGDIELSGTIGQPDAGAMSGGAYTLSGGFWFALEPTDCDEDGVVNGHDVASLLQCLDGPGVPTDESCRCFDADGSGEVDLRDVAQNQLHFDGN